MSISGAFAKLTNNATGTMAGADATAKLMLNTASGAAQINVSASCIVDLTTLTAESGSAIIKHAGAAVAVGYVMEGSGTVVVANLTAANINAADNSAITTGGTLTNHKINKAGSAVTVSTAADDAGATATIGITGNVDGTSVVTVTATTKG